MPMLGTLTYRETGYGLVEVTRQSPFTPPRTGATATLPLTIKQFEEAYKKWSSGALIQIAFPHLDADAREFLMTGMLPSQFEALMNSGE